MIHLQSYYEIKKENLLFIYVNLGKTHVSQNELANTYLRVGFFWLLGLCLFFDCNRMICKQNSQELHSDYLVTVIQLRKMQWFKPRHISICFFNTFPNQIWFSALLQKSKPQRKQERLLVQVTVSIFSFLKPKIILTLLTGI